MNHIDHVTVPTADIMKDVAFFRDTLDYRFTEWTVLDDKSDLAVFAMMTTNEQAHDPRHPWRSFRHSRTHPITLPIISTNASTSNVRPTS